MENNSSTRKKIAFVGKSAVGKNHMISLLQNLGFRAVIGYTSRPPREGEKDGVDYHFVDNEKFWEMVNDGKFLQFMFFADCGYGTTIEEFENCDFFITSPIGLEHIPEEHRHRIKIVELVCDDNIRRLRSALGRPDHNDEDFKMRSFRDTEMFKGFDEKAKALGYEHVKLNTESFLEICLLSGEVSRYLGNDGIFAVRNDGKTTFL